MKKFNISEEYFWNEIDLPMLKDMLAICEMSKEEHGKIWEVKRELGELYD